MRRCLAALLAASWAGSALAQVTVVSPGAASTSITIYRDGIAQITETRELELPEGPVTLVLQGVTETLLPQSAVINGLGRTSLENNYDFDMLTPASLIQRSVGKQVIVVRTDPVRGVATRALATIQSAANGVVLRFDEGVEAMHCAGLPERLEFLELPGELSGKPALSVKLAAGPAGPRTVTVSYLAQQFSWSADYVAQLNAASDRMDLLGWVTLTNATGTSYPGAQVQVVAGRVGLLYDYERGSRPASIREVGQGDGRAGEFDSRFGMLLLPACHPVSIEVMPPAPPPPMVTRAPLVEGEFLEEVQVTGSRIMSREELGDYQLYRIDWPTDLNARQTKQAAFLSARRAKVERVYRVYFRAVSAYHDPDSVGRMPVHVGLRWDNEKSSGLGVPLPAGNIAVFEPGAGGPVFAGEARLGDQAVGAEIEFDFARALNMAVVHSVAPIAEEEDRDDDEAELEDLRDAESLAQRVSHRLINDKSVAVKVEIQTVLGPDGWHATDTRRTSQRPRRKDGDPLWVRKVPAGTERRVEYEIYAETNP